jgi:hypothetical protein
LAGTLFFGHSSSSTSPGSSRKILYRDALQTRHLSKFSWSPWYRIQSLGHACIFSICNPRGQAIFFALYIVVGNSLGFRSNFFWIFSNFLNALSDIPFAAFHCNNSSVVPSFFCPSYADRYSNFLWSSSIWSNLAFSFSLL